LDCDDEERDGNTDADERRSHGAFGMTFVTPEIDMIEEEMKLEDD
jgi:hypothetical protein